MRPSVGLGGVKPAITHETHLALWTALVAALTMFIRAARQHLNMSAGETCPRCGHKY